MIKPGDEPIPGYRVERMLGRGQYGEVWRATTPGRSNVALKVLDMTGRRGWKEFRAVQRVKQIRHAHLMPIVAIWLVDEDGRVLDDDHLDGLAAKDDTEMLVADTVAYENPPAQMIIATLLADVSLRDRLDDCLDEGLDGIPVDELIGYMQETAKGIDFLNSIQHAWAGGQVGVQHCDIKPDNVMLVGGSVVICDFGVAQILADASGSARATSLSGSPAYMAPEAFEAKPSPTSDQYSLAVTYYELRTATLPTSIESFAAAYEAHRTGKLDFSNVGDREQAVLQKATSFDPQKRYETTSAFVSALSQATQPPPIVPKRPIFWIATLFLLLGGGAVAGLWGTKHLWPNTSRVELQFDAPNASLIVNGQAFSADENGLLEVRLPRDAATVIESLGDQERKEKKWTIDPSELVDTTRFEFAVPFTAAHFAAEAEKLLASGKIIEAADVYANVLADGTDGDEKYVLLPEPQLIQTSGMNWSDCLSITPDGKRVVSAGRDGIARSWPVTMEGVSASPAELQSHDDSSIVALAASDRIVATVCERGIIQIHKDGRSRRLHETDSAETRLALTGDGKTLVAAVPDAGVPNVLTTRILAWDVDATDMASTLRELGQQPGEIPRIVGCDEDSVVVATIDDAALVWRWRAASGSHDELGRQPKEVFSLAASGDGTVIAYAGAAPTSGDEDTSGAAIVDLKLNVGYRLASTQADSILACTLGFKGELLATAERMSQFNDTGSVVLWRPRPLTGTAAMERILEFDRELGDVAVLQMSNDPNWIVAGHETGAVSLWWQSGTSKLPFATFGRGDKIAALRITPDQRWLVSGSRDGRMLVFDLWRLEMLYRACKKAGIQPRLEPSRVTLRDRPLWPVVRFRAVGEGIAYPPLCRPSVRPA